MFVQFVSFSLPRTGHVTMTILKHAGIPYCNVSYSTVRTVSYDGCTCLGTDSGFPNDIRMQRWSQVSYLVIRW